jgi:two-component system NtrC family sensor kinase
MDVKLGIRLQILLLLGGLLLLAFVHLHYAVATYSAVTLQRLQESSARSLGRAVAGHVAEARSSRSRERLSSLLDAEVGTSGVAAIGVYDTSGMPLLRAGEVGAIASLPERVKPTHEDVYDVHTERGRALAVVVPDPDGAVLAIVRADEQATQVLPLARLLALYTAVVAAALLLAAYFLLTRLIVQPLDTIGRAAERVAGGSRRFELPVRGPAELSALARSLHTMTQRLLDNEDRLRRQIDEVERATRELEQAQQRLIRSERLASVGRLAAGLAHEIGNPIAAMIGMEELLLAGGLSDREQQDFLQRMRKETDRINRILSDLLAFARPSAQRGEGPSEPGDVAQAVQDVAALVAPQKSMAEVALGIETDPKLPLVTLSREHLVQVLLNLLLNAADACQGGGRILITARASSDGVALSVEDDGPGVAPDVRERLFEPFVTTKEVGQGTGLGLAVCRGLVEAAGGTIALDPDTTSGARFLIELPAAGITE